MKKKNEFFANYFIDQLEKVIDQLKTFANKEKDQFGYDPKKDNLPYEFRNYPHVSEYIKNKYIEWLEKNNPVYPPPHHRPKKAGEIRDDLEAIIEEFEATVFNNEKMWPVRDMWEEENDPTILYK